MDASSPNDTWPFGDKVMTDVFIASPSLPVPCNLPVEKRQSGAAIILLKNDTAIQMRGTGWLARSVGHV
ncbi:hypothetical protein RB195_004368 [Necator americanus]|uniref:Uncharacterized protein n=1 Tax=Necator americanus TaxID=51031 RepID=A0ABR1BHM0_NECAM